MTNNISTTDDLWPKKNDWLTYIWPTYIDKYSGDSILTEGNQYQVKNISHISCYDRIEVIDDMKISIWIEMYKFSFFDQHGAE